MRHAPPRRCVVRVPCTRRTAGPSAALPIHVPAEERHGTVASSSSPRRHGRAPYLSTAAPFCASHREARPPLPPSRQARPPASIPGRLTILTYSLGPLEACVVAHMLGIAPPRRSRSPLRPSPPAIAVHRRRVPFRPNSEHQRALCSEHGLISHLVRV
jgi:hypothetical protein